MNNFRQLMCQCSLGLVQEPKGTCTLHTVPQPILEAYVVAMMHLDTCSRGTPAHKNYKG